MAQCRNFPTIFHYAFGHQVVGFNEQRRFERRGLLDAAADEMTKLVVAHGYLLDWIRDCIRYNQFAT
ncbi:hypothetical protein REMIM1_PE00222 (plasmid) [Rhizobium etli bv. mimosae str. Mim1]|nr:hypothetical protein REMIM1_PE00222 [Rhizobium etli bv. mimosae str. Mim1]